jgi:hypothetical protein
MFAVAIHKHNFARLFFALVNLCMRVEAIEAEKGCKVENKFLHEMATKNEIYSSLCAIKVPGKLRIVKR